MCSWFRRKHMSMYMDIPTRVCPLMQAVITHPKACQPRRYDSETPSAGGEVR
jgi:hypothetical protein